MGKKQITILIFCLMLFTASSALALTKTVEYVDEGGNIQAQECIVIESGDNWTFETDTWYLAEGQCEILNRIKTEAKKSTPAYLILADGAELRVPKGIHVSGENGLTIYGQKMSSGQLVITEPSRSKAGIGANYSGYCGNITINGGIIKAQGGQYAAGIGGGFGGGIHGTITIHNGTVTAAGGESGAGIGTGRQGSNGGSIYITGGKVTAVGGSGGAGIGTGYKAAGAIDKLIFNGMLVTAKAGKNTRNDIGAGYRTSYGITYIYDRSHKYPLPGDIPPLPKTGDENKLLLWGLLMVISSMTFLGIITHSKIRRTKRQTGICGGCK